MRIHKVRETHISRSRCSVCVCMCECMCTVCTYVIEAINYSINRSPWAQEENKSTEIWTTTSFSLIGFRLDEHFVEMLLRQSEEFKMGWNITPREQCRTRPGLKHLASQWLSLFHQVYSISYLSMKSIHHASFTMTRALTTFNDAFKSDTCFL